MSLAIEKSPQAKADLFAAAVYLDLQTLGLGDRFYARAEIAFQQLAEMPGLGALREFRLVRSGEVRSWRIRGFENWLIFYRVTDEAVEILRVLHGARDLNELFGDEAPVE